MNTNQILVKITKYDYSSLIKYLIRNNIFYKDLNQEENCIKLKINKEDYKKIKKDLKSITIIKYLGLPGILSFIKKHYIIIISFLITYLLLILLSNVIFDIEIISNNKELKETISLYLSESGIEKYKFKKSTKELEAIKETILKENKNTLEWIEIERIGTTYRISLTERIINEINGENTPSDIVASKDALIMYIITKNGTKMKEVNEIVKKGEVIISGNIIKNESIVDTVKAQGEVYGEVWYTVTTTVPFKHVDYEKTGEMINHIYLDVFGKKITLMGKYDTKESMNTTTVLIDKPYLFFKVIKEAKELYEYKHHTLTEDEAYQEALKRSDKSVEVQLSEGEHIIDKKVLKINKYSSKIEVEIFYKVYESIGSSKEITIINPEGE